MAVDPQLLQQALRTPESADVTDSPIVRAVILTDPANVVDLVAVLDREGSLEARNARRVLCQFGPEAVPALLSALAAVPSVRAREEGLGALAGMLTLVDRATVRSSLSDAAAGVRALTADTRPVPVAASEHVEVDFTGRVCDLTYVVVRELWDPEFDQSPFRAADGDGRDAQIRVWLERGLRDRMV